MGLLLFLLFVAAFLGAFVLLFRMRVRRNLERSGLQVPPELLQLRAPAPSGGAPAGARPAMVGATSPPAAARAPHFLLIYDVGPDFIARRAQYRDEHLKLAWQASQRGELLLAGALEEPTTHAFLLFSGSREAALRFAAADPYVKHGLVRNFRVKQWLTTVGERAANPIRPA
jgi:uncharacterized protein